MKFCKKAFEHMYVIDAEGGQVWPCAWLNSKGSEFCMGNILTQSVEEIFNSEKAKHFRESILDGSFRYCSMQECCDLANGWLPDMTQEEINEISKNSEPQTFVLAFEETCNHACSSCRHEYFKGSEDYYRNVELIGEKLIPYLNRAIYVDANGRGEIMVSEHMLRMLSKVTPEREEFTFYIETNAALFDAKHFERIRHLTDKNCEVTATVNSFHDSTYRYLNGYSNHVDQVIENLKYMKELRDQGVINKLTISMVAQEPNFREIPEWTERCLNEFQADAVRIRGIMRFNMDENEFWFKDVFNPAHPYYREALDVLHHPIMSDERVWFWEGDYENVRKPKQMPMQRFRQNYDLLWSLFNMRQNGTLKKELESFHAKKVVLWGTGHVTAYLIEAMQENGIIPLAILDSYRRDECYCGIPLHRISDDSRLPDVEIILNTAVFYEKEIKELLEKKSFKGHLVSLCDFVNEAG